MFSNGLHQNIPSPTGSNRRGACNDPKCVRILLWLGNSFVSDSIGRVGGGLDTKLRGLSLRFHCFLRLRSTMFATILEVTKLRLLMTLLEYHLSMGRWVYDGRNGAHGAKGGSLSRTSLATESMSSILGSLVADLGVVSVLPAFIVESMKLTSQREGRIGIVDIADDRVSGRISV